MKDFDAERTSLSAEDREFKIRGEVFVRREEVKPEVLVGYDDLREDTGAARTLEIIDQLIVDLIEDGGDAHGRYTTLRAREDNPVTLDDLLEVSKWLMTEVTNRPTTPPSDSSEGSESGRTGTSSTANSSSLAAVV